MGRAAFQLTRMGLMALAVVTSGCSGTVLEMEGQICGQPVKLRMADAKDRSAFELAITCGPGGSVMVSTAESSASQVLTAQAHALTGQVQALSNLAGVLAREAATGTLP